LRELIHIIWNMKIGGAERSLYQLIKEQNNRGFHSDLLIINETGYYGEKCKEICSNLYSLNLNNFPSKKEINDFTNILKNYNRAHFHSAEFRYIAIASHILGLKRYYSHRAGIHNFTFKQFLRHKITGYYLRKYFTGFSANTKLGAKSASLIYEIPESKFLITYNGLDFNLLKEDKSKDEIKNNLDLNDEIIIGTSANIRKWKRIDKLLYLIKKIKGNVKCLIIGDGPDKQRLIKFSKDLKVEDKVIFISKVENIMNYLQIIDIFVLPSNNSESFGNSAVESMAVGIPTIVFSDGGGLVEHILDKKTGYIVNNNNELFSIAMELINNSHLRNEIGLNGKNYIREKYSLEKMINNYNKVYFNN
jgi:glycosyltransferase involved in cell wall biosynthesis